MKFKNDSQRKAVFANLFNREGRRTKVNSSNITNFEVKTTKIRTQKFKPLNFSYKPVVLKDIKTKDLKEFCNMCKRRGLSLTKGRCKVCSVEKEKFDKTERVRKDLTNHEKEKLALIAQEFMSGAVTAYEALLDRSDWMFGDHYSGEDREEMEEFVGNMEAELESLGRSIALNKKRKDVKFNTKRLLDLIENARSAIVHEDVNPTDLAGWDEPSQSDYNFVNKIGRKIFTDSLWSDL